jgi:hypothetical protein
MSRIWAARHESSLKKATSTDLTVDQGNGWGRGVQRGLVTKRPQVAQYWLGPPLTASLLFIVVAGFPEKASDRLSH